MTAPARSPWRTRLTFALIALLLIELLLWATAPLLRSVAEQQLGALLQRQVTIARLSLNPLTLTLQADGVKLATLSGEQQLAFARLEIDANLWGSLRHRGWVIDSISLVAPDLYLARTGANRYNISDLLDRFLNQPDDHNPSRFSLNNLSLHQGRIVFDDRPASHRQQIDQLQVSLPFVSNLPYFVDDPVQPGLSGRLNGARFASSAQARPFSATRQARLTLQLDDIDLSHFLAYLPQALNVRLQSARLDSRLTLDVAQQPAQAPTLALGGTLVLRNVRLQQPDGSPLLAWQRAELQLGRIEPLLQRYWLASLQIDQPELVLQRLADGRLNLQQAFAVPTATPTHSARPPSPLQLNLTRLTLQQGRLHWLDRRTGFSSTLTPITLQLQQLALPASQPLRFQLQFASERQEQLRADGQVTFQPLSLATRLQLTRLDLPGYAPYYRPYLAIRPVSGRFDADVRLHYDAQGLRLQQAGATLDGLQLLPPQGKRPFLALQRLQLYGSELDLAQRRLLLGRIDSQGLQVQVRRNQQGQIDLLQWLGIDPATAPATPAGPAWRWQVNELQLSNYGLDWFDEAPIEDAHLALAGLRLQVRGLRPDQPATVELASRINRRGQLRLSGSLQPQPLQGRLKVGASQIELTPLQPYFGHRLNIMLTSGLLGGSGQLQLATQPKLSAEFSGNLSIDRLASIDKLNQADFLNWHSLRLDGLRAGTERLQIDRLTLARFYSRLLVNPDGRLNLLDIVAADDRPAGIAPQLSAPATPPAQPYPVQFGKVLLSGGNVAFSDYFIRPNYSANMTGIGGSISGLSSTAGTRASIDLAGSVNQNAQFSLAGHLNPLAQPLFLDIKAAIKGFEMTPTSPYAGKYAGYGIDKGKLSMEISYFVDQNQLKAQNHLFLDQLTLGDKVDSPDATALPVRLALSLLQNRRGEIDLNLPIEGSLDDPQFKIGRVIVQVLKNLLEKAATAPFALLTGGGGQELSFIDFPAGSSTLTPTAHARLEALATALQDRPALKLEIAGHADAATDSAGLQQQWLQQKVRAFKARQQTQQGRTGDDAATVSTQEYPALLQAVYLAEDFPKPRNLIGQPKPLPLADMEHALLQQIVIQPDDLQQLATQRAFAAKQALLQSGKIEEKRLFIVFRKPATPPTGASPARAEFTLGAP